MFKNYLIIAYRSLLRHKLYSGINILGLAGGLAVCLLIFMFVRDEVSYDRFFADSERIHRLTTIFATQQVSSPEARLTYRAAELLENDFPEVEDAVRLIRISDSPLFSNGDNRFYEDEFYFGDSTFFEVFDLPFLSGDRATALDEPSTIVITETIARKYFGRTNVVGESLLMNDTDNLTVSGVIRDLPGNTHFSFDIVASAGSMGAVFGAGLVNNLQSWGWPSSYTYLKLKPGADAEALAAKFPEFMVRNEGQKELSLYLNPVTDIHLRSHRELEMQPNGDIVQVYTMSAIAILILLIACINFMNLATARSSLRAQEVGMRKVVGARHGQLVSQFLSQSVLMAMIATTVAVFVVQLVLGPFNAFVGKQLSLDLFRDPVVVVALLILAITVGIGAGLYPAWFLSRSRLQFLIGSRNSARANAILRKSLVVFQFSISIILVVVTGTVYSQMKFANDLDLGYEKDQIVVVSGLGQLDEEITLDTVRDRLLEHSGIESVTLSGLVPTEPLFSGTGFRLPGMSDDDEPHFLRVNGVAFDFFETYEIKMVAGRSFSREFQSDLFSPPSDDGAQRTGGLILNESAAAKLGYSPEEAIDKTVLFRDIELTVVGVARDIYFSSVQYAIEPLAYFASVQEGNLSIRLTGSDIPASLEHIDLVWAELAPGYPIARSFLDDRFDQLYESEQRSATVVTSFSLLAVLIASLGLMGLAAFTAETRRREIGVRKVLGASVRDVIILLSSEFGKLVLIANVIAWPVAWYLADKWLSGYAYRTNIGIGLFVGAGLLAFIVAILTVGFQARRAAIVNPVTSIRA